MTCKATLEAAGVEEDKESAVGMGGEDTEAAGREATGLGPGLGVYHFMIRGLPFRLEPPLTTFGDGEWR